ncbi:hypothetical protein SKAU_G00173130 [Synaphobranchus kaupii]|uniref:Uncharacterized protein n=1 Tax=Synaphobranchus kaupii TaxID=118154 RepID=A0A9Q1FKP4_SYNKA|nr:hypothetical protein SKAU_G00173130 [Synaphobranchus kaupii]
MTWQGIHQTSGSVCIQEPAVPLTRVSRSRDPSCSRRVNNANFPPSRMTLKQMVGPYPHFWISAEKQLGAKGE